MCTDCPKALVPYHVKAVPEPVCQTLKYLPGNAAAGEVWNKDLCPDWCLETDPVGQTLTGSGTVKVRVCEISKSPPWYVWCTWIRSWGWQLGWMLGSCSFHSRLCCISWEGCPDAFSDGNRIDLIFLAAWRWKGMSASGFHRVTLPSLSFPHLLTAALYSTGMADHNSFLLSFVFSFSTFVISLPFYFTGLRKASNVVDWFVKRHTTFVCLMFFANTILPGRARNTRVGLGGRRVLTMLWAYTKYNLRPKRLTEMHTF